MISSSNPCGRRIWRHTTPVTTSERTYGAKNSVRRIARPLIRVLSSIASPSANGIWNANDSTMMMTLWRSAAVKLRVGERSPEVVEADELVERLEPVPVVQAVAHALHDRIDDEHAVEQQRRREERDDHRPWHPHQRSLAVGGARAQRLDAGVLMGWCPVRCVVPVDASLAASTGTTVSTAACSSAAGHRSDRGSGVLRRCLHRRTAMPSRR